MDAGRGSSECPRLNWSRLDQNRVTLLNDSGSRNLNSETQLELKQLTWVVVLSFHWQTGHARFSRGCVQSSARKVSKHIRKFSTITGFWIASFWVPVQKHIHRLKNYRKLSRRKFHDNLPCEFTAHYACRNADINLKSTATNGFKFRTINSSAESWWVHLTGLDCNVCIVQDSNTCESKVVGCAVYCKRRELCFFPSCLTICDPLE